MEAMHPDVDHILFTEEEITAMVKRVGAQSLDHKASEPVPSGIERKDLTVVFLFFIC